MGMDLIGKGGEFSANWRAWGALLELAERNGWEPLGTEAPDYWDEVPKPEGEIWKGTYCSNDYQWVTEEDAGGIADALTRALQSASTPELKSGDYRVYVEEFIAFCRAGGFAIG